MRNVAKSRDRVSLFLTCLFCFGLFHPAYAQQNQQILGNIFGRLHVTRGGAPPERVLVLLQFRGATIQSVYSDSEGNFGFHYLDPNPYYVAVDDEHYQPEQRQALIPPTSLQPQVFVDITLVPKETAKKDEQIPAKSTGSNPNITDVREYESKFPKTAVKEFKKGAQSDQDGKKDDAIKHYQKAIQIAPAFYEAHNNLGSDYVSKSDFPAARKEFEQAIQQNQSDAAGYFNLSNVSMLTGNLPEAQNYLNEGLRREPDSALGQFLLGSLNMKTGKLPEAEKALQQSIKLNPTMVQPRLQLVNLFLQTGKKQAAAEQLHEFVTTFPDNPFSPQARKVLEKIEGPAQAKAPN
jgi:tetratricopeptide (TPR) repeat protein